MLITAAGLSLGQLLGEFGLEAEQIGYVRVLAVVALAVGLVVEDGGIGDSQLDRQNVPHLLGPVVLEESAGAGPPQGVGVLGDRLRRRHGQADRAVAGEGHRIGYLGQLRPVADFRQPRQRVAGAESRREQDRRREAKCILDNGAGHDASPSS